MASALLAPGWELTTLMPWVRFDDQFATHRKVDGLSDTAFRLHVAAIFWCARNLMDGFVPEGDLDLVCARVRAPARFAAECVVRGLWHLADEDCPSADCPAPADENGWVVHDYFQYQPRKEEVLAERSGKSDGGKLGNHRRWHEERGVTDPACGYCRKPGGRKSDKRSDNRSGRGDIHSPPSDTDRITDRSSESGANPPVPTRSKPPSAPRSIQSPILFAMPDVRPEEGEKSGELTPGQLVAAIRRERPDWSTRSIERALADASVTERPWPLVCAAALIVARDPESKHAGRLAHDGPWWAEAAALLGAAVAPKPPWCGKCDERTRQRERDDGRPARCPDCHPSLRKESA